MKGQRFLLPEVEPRARHVGAAEGPREVAIPLTCELAGGEIRSVRVMSENCGEDYKLVHGEDYTEKVGMLKVCCKEMGVPQSRGPARPRPRCLCRSMRVDRVFSVHPKLLRQRQPASHSQFLWSYSQQAEALRRLDEKREERGEKRGKERRKSRSPTKNHDFSYSLLFTILVSKL